MQVTDAVIIAAARELGEDGHPYTPRQLYYAVCAAVEVPRIPIAPGVLSTGVILLLLAVIASHVAVLAAAFALLGSLLLVYGMRLRVLEAHRLSAVRARALSYDSFIERLSSARDVDAGAFTALADPAAGPPPGDAPTPVVVCDTVENAVIVAALLRREGIGGTVVAHAAASAELLTRAPLLVVHDASASACALPVLLREAGATAVIDAGVRPRDVEGRDLQIIEGAPGIRGPRDLAGVLEPAEVAWLAAGRRLELAALPADDLTRLLRQALGEPISGATSTGDSGGAGEDVAAR